MVGGWNDDEYLSSAVSSSSITSRSSAVTSGPSGTSASGPSRPS